MDTSNHQSITDERILSLLLRSPNSHSSSSVIGLSLNQLDVDHCLYGHKSSHIIYMLTTDNFVLVADSLYAGWWQFVRWLVTVCVLTADCWQFVCWLMVMGDEPAPDKDRRCHLQSSSAAPESWKTYSQDWLSVCSFRFRFCFTFMYWFLVLVVSDNKNGDQQMTIEMSRNDQQMVHMYGQWRFGYINKYHA